MELARPVSSEHDRSVTYLGRQIDETDLAVTRLVRAWDPTVDTVGANVVRLEGAVA